MKIPKDTISSLRLSLDSRREITSLATYYTAGTQFSRRPLQKLWKLESMGRYHVLTALDPELGLADILIDDVADAELLLLPQPHQLHTLMDKDVLLLCLDH